jgi:hypothetical protein
VRKADNLTTFTCRLSWSLGASISWKPQGLSRPVMGLLYLFTFREETIVSLLIAKGKREIVVLISWSLLHASRGLDDGYTPSWLKNRDHQITISDRYRNSIAQFASRNGGVLWITRHSLTVFKHAFVRVASMWFRVTVVWFHKECAHILLNDIKEYK